MKLNLEQFMNRCDEELEDLYFYFTQGLFIHYK